MVVAVQWENGCGDDGGSAVSNKSYHLVRYWVPAQSRHRTKWKEMWFRELTTGPSKPHGLYPLWVIILTCISSRGGTHFDLRVNFVVGKIVTKITSHLDGQDGLWPWDLWHYVFVVIIMQFYQLHGQILHTPYFICPFSTLLWFYVLV